MGFQQDNPERTPAKTKPVLLYIDSQVFKAWVCGLRVAASRKEVEAVSSVETDTGKYAVTSALQRSRESRPKNFSHTTNFFVDPLRILSYPADIAMDAQA